jgi:hypothetical protein
MQKIEAINRMLSVIGEAPVTSLDDADTFGITDQSIALRTLDEVLVDVLSEGWVFNTDLGLELERDINDEFVLPGSALRSVFTIYRYPDGNYIVRNGKVWDRIKKTTVLPDVDKITVDRVIRNLDWDDIPYPAQQYITIRAARIFSNRYVNSNVVYSYTAADEENARMKLLRDEESQQVHNMLWGNNSGLPQGSSYLPRMGMRNRIR